ncbi:MAG: class I SAM-dependent methyltransferase [Victivallales bacterium]|nr:class I SAM-dependent methyltransferase [Victivallales bacterium]
MAYTPSQHRAAADFFPDKYPLQKFPEAEWQTFCSQCAALEIPDPESSRGTLEALYSHLVGINTWLNLTRLTSVEDYLKFQVLDSLSILKIIAPMLEENDTVMDLGSGGGYPALPLMTWLDSQYFVLVDSRQKKVDFLNATIPLIPRSGKGVALSCRGRDIGKIRTDLSHHASIVTARAVGRGADLLEDAAAMLAVGGVFVLLKGPSWPETEAPEFDAACPVYGFEVADDITFSLVPGDPVHHVILAVKTGKGDTKKLRKLQKRR